MRFLFLMVLLGVLWTPLSSSEGREIWLMAQRDSANSTFDPFIDYGEFQDNVTEEESVNFFQNGRSLTLSLSGGYEALSLNMRQIYGDAPFLGANLSFFLDFHFALQVSGVFPAEHYNSLLGTNSSIAHYGMDLKYYFNRQYIDKELDLINPYLIFGPFWLQTQSQLPSTLTSQTFTPNPTSTDSTSGEESSGFSQEELNAVQKFHAAGIKVGFGIEFPLIKQSFFGAEVSYLYTVLQHENQDLSQLDLPPVRYSPHQNIQARLLYPNRPQLEGYRFFGDLLNISLLFGVNF